MFETCKGLVTTLVAWLVTALLVIFVITSLLWMSVELWRNILHG